jgi:hypothetical protein
MAHCLAEPDVAVATEGVARLIRVQQANLAVRTRPIKGYNKSIMLLNFS